MYTFLFDRKSLALLLTGAAAAGILFFVAGVLVGLRINLPGAPVRTAEFQTLSSFEGGLVKSATAEPASDLTVPQPTAAAELSPMPAQPAPPSKEPAAEPVRPAPPAAQPVSVPAQAAATPTVPPPAPSRPAPTASQPVAEPALPSQLAPIPIEPEEEVTRLAPVPIETDAEVTQQAAIPVEADAESAQPAATSTAPAPEPVPVAAPAAEPASSVAAGQGNYVQVGAYGVVENAEKQLALVLSEGFPGYVATIRLSAGGTLSAVRFGGYPTLRAAFADAQKYLAAGQGREAIVHSAK